MLVAELVWWLASDWAPSEQNMGGVWALAEHHENNYTTSGYDVINEHLLSTYKIISQLWTPAK